MKKKKIVIILSFIVVFILFCIGTFMYFLTPVGGNSKVTFTVKSGESKMEILDNLKNANIIKSKYITLILSLIHI